MNSAIRILFLILISLTSYFTYAQNYQYSTDNKKAIKSYDNAVSSYQYGDYESALKDLNRATELDDSFIEAWLLLGDLYTDAGFPEKAIHKYEKALSIDSTFFSGTYYFLGNLYYEAGYYGKSVARLEKYLQFEDLSREMVDKAYSLLENARIAEKLVSDPVPVTPENIGAPVNTPNDEYINYVSPENNRLIFTKKIPENSRKRYKEQLYTSQKSDNVWNNPSLINIGWLDERYNMGTINFSTDGRIMYFTGCYWPGGIGSCDIYKSNRLGSDWLIPNNLERPINTEGWDSQPIISSDGKRLYFSSIRAGGKGGADIWMSVMLENGNWSPPVNMGDSINTSGNEMAPFLHADGRTLFFASTGHPGMGGFDLFVSRIDDTGIWSKAENIGYPVNTKYNELIILSSIDGKHNWLSSDRQGGKGNYDIYYFDTYDKVMPQKVMYILGKVVDNDTKKPLKAEVEITNLKTGININSTISDSITGEFLLVIYPDIEYAFNISKSGYLFYSENINLIDTIANDLINHTFYLSPLRAGTSITMNNIFFEFNSSDLMQSSYTELNRLLETLENSDFSFEIIGHTDNIGSNDYNMNLSLDRAKSVGKFLIDNGINSLRISYTAKGASEPVESNETEYGRALNRRTEIKIQ